MLTAIRSSDSIRKNIYRTFIGEIELYEQKAGVSMPDESIKKMLHDVRKEDEKILETLLDKLTKADIERLKLEVDICSEFLPERISIDELSSLMTEEILSMANIGKAIGKTKEMLSSLNKSADAADITFLIKKAQGEKSV